MNTPVSGDLGSYRPTTIDGVHIFEPVLHADPRGQFLEWFKADELAETLGYPLIAEQANLSVSAAGVVRGVHLAQVPPGQAKLVTCVVGQVTDVIVDLRRGSPTYLQHLTVELDDESRRAVYLPVGVGHAFLSHRDGSTVVYLTSTAYDPETEFAVNISDPALGIDIAGILGGLSPVLSDRDQDAPLLAEVTDRLPDYDDCVAYTTELRDLWATSNEAAGDDLTDADSTGGDPTGKGAGR